MKIGTIEAGAGEKAYGQFKTGETHGRFPVHIPLHIINGAQDGPTLVVQSGLSGLEIEPALILPQIVKELDPAHIKGTVVVVPLMNTSGFEFTQIVSAWDGKHLNKLGRGNLNGTISEQMIAQYYDAVINPADALLDIRSGSQWAYNRYAGIYSAGEADKSQAMAVATGLPQVVTGQAADGSLAYEAATDGKAVTVANIGGGPGLRDYRADDMARNRRAVLNTMRHLGMLDGDMEYEAGTITVIEAHTIIMPDGERGFTFMDTSKRGTQVAAGEEIGYVRHPFTGEVVQKITAPQAGIVVFAGASWPVPLEDTLLAMLGDLKEEISVS